MQVIYGESIHIGRLYFFLFLMPYSDHLLADDGLRHLFWRFYWKSTVNNKSKVRADQLSDLTHINYVIFVESDLLIKALGELTGTGHNIGSLGYVDKSNNTLYVVYGDSSRKIISDLLTDNTYFKRVEDYHNVKYQTAGISVRLVARLSYLITDNGSIIKNRYGDQDIVDAKLAETIEVLLKYHLK